ncbi:protein-L-isoaspartate O-methyltransferase family protein [Coralliovum pocilloporae]|uniref:protein-L-isoaspartate O-methyltransferase family protein n=1 Tax=Coralliovum pocilloporae TaxID=3066369 RepID=UPI0033070AD6
MMTDFAAARTKMVDNQLRTTDVTDARVLSVMGQVPREVFVPSNLHPLAYIDEDIRLSAGDDPVGDRYLMEPSPFAKLVQLADIGNEDVVLDIGCGSGYSSAVLASLADSVVALEETEDLVSSVEQHLSEADVDNVAVVQGDLKAGYPSEGPYDVIFINGAVSEVPEDLKAQLKDGGRLVAVVGYGRASQAMLYIRSGDQISGRIAFNTAIPPLTGFEPEDRFEF